MKTEIVVRNVDLNVSRNLTTLNKHLKNSTVSEFRIQMLAPNRAITNALNRISKWNV